MFFQTFWDILEINEREKTALFAIQKISKIVWAQLTNWLAQSNLMPRVSGYSGQEFRNGSLIHSFKTQDNTVMS